MGYPLLDLTNKTAVVIGGTSGIGLALTKALAQAWAPKITVNSVAPGVIPFGEPDDRVKRLIAKTPAGRAGAGSREGTRS